MNREQRRAAKFKRSNRDRNHVRSAPTGGLGIIPMAQQYSDDEFRRLSLNARLAWHKLANGMGTQDDFDMLATCLNVAAVMAADIDELALDVLDRGMTAMVAMKERYMRLGRFGADADALQAMPHALNVHDEIIKNSTPLQTVTALRTSMKMVEQGTVIVAPEMSVITKQLTDKAQGVHP